MNYTEIIKRAARITWRYKFLWIFGILLALTSGGGGGGGGGSNAANSTGNGAPWLVPPSGNWNGPSPAAILSILALCCCALLVLIVVSTIVRYVARTALYRSVDQIEATGVAPTWRQGFRLGWSNRALRIFLLDLLIVIVFFLAAMLLLAVGASPLLLLLIDSGPARALGIAMTVGLELLVILLLVVAGIVVFVLGQFWAREIALADRTVGEALSSGYRLVRRRIGDVGVMWFFLAVIGFVFAIVAIPLFLLLAVLAVAAGGGVGWAVYTLSDSWLWAVLLGLPIFLLIVAVPSIIVFGIYQVFQSSAWTLVYRDVAGSPRVPAVVEPSGGPPAVAMV